MSTVKRMRLCGVVGVSKLRMRMWEVNKVEGLDTKAEKKPSWKRGAANSFIHLLAFASWTLSQRSVLAVNYGAGWIIGGSAVMACPC